MYVFSHVYFKLPSSGFSHPHLYPRKTFVIVMLSRRRQQCVVIFSYFCADYCLRICLCLLMIACYISINTFLVPGEWHQEKCHNNQHVLFTWFKNKTMCVMALHGNSMSVSCDYPNSIFRQRGPLRFFSGQISVTFF